MGSSNPPGTLSIALDTRARVLLTVAGTSAPALGRLVTAFPSSRRDANNVLSLDLAHFLPNIANLNAWKEGPVLWAHDLADMVRTSILDGEFLETVMSGQQPLHAEISAETLAAVTEQNWVGPLNEFQTRDVTKMLRMRHASNFSVPGAGKTRTALATYSRLKADGVVDSLIVVAPKSAQESWRAEASMVYHVPLGIQILDGANHEFGELTLVNYERLPSAQNAIAGHLRTHSTLLILDEAHRMKRGANGVYGAICLSLGPLATRRMVLSGTPAPNGLDDLQSLLEFAWPGRGSSILRKANTATRAEVLAPLFTRTTKKDLRLPPLKIRVKRVQLPPLHRKLYDALLGQFAATVADSERIDDLGRVVVYLLMAATSPALLAVGASRYEALQFRVPPLPLPPGDHVRSLLAQLPAHEMSPKIAEAIRIVRENAAVGRKTLVWSTFLRNISTLEVLLEDLNPAVVTGATGDEERQLAIAKFRSDPSSMVLLSNPATLGEGISLHHECHEAVYIDRDFAAGRFLQSLDRIHRLGLASGTVTNVRVLVADETIDVLVNSRLDAKIRLMDSILDDPSLRQLVDLEEERESGGVMDLSDISDLRSYLAPL
jgi:SNF2 family DNA or RNA helicase